MRADALMPYELALHGSAPLSLSCADGRVIELDVARWLAPVDVADLSVLDRCSGPTLDVGCGPGRFVSALNERGVPALGVDIAAAAVALTRLRGTPALLRSVFDRVPGTGRWPTVLLMDGNIGIGGDPLRLLHRVRRLLAPDGVVIVEAHADPDVDETLTVRFVMEGDVVGPEFGWANVGAHALRAYAGEAGFLASDSWCAEGRTFVCFAA